LTHSGRLTHKVVTRQPWIRRRSGKVCRLQTDVLTTEPRRHCLNLIVWVSMTPRCGAPIWRAVFRNFAHVTINVLKCFLGTAEVSA